MKKRLFLLLISSVVSSPLFAQSEYSQHEVFTTGLNVPNQMVFNTDGILFVANHSYASYTGEYSNTIARIDAHNGQEGSATFTASIILAGQIRGMEPRLFLIYPEGNFIEASFDTPFFQIGETKYGRPILIRGYEPGMSFEDAVKLLMVSFDSTIKANLSVGMPLDLLVIARDRFEAAHARRIAADDSYYRAISAGWSEALKLAFESLPDYSFYHRSGG